MRHGEVLGLFWDDISFDGATLDVRQTLDKTTGNLKDPKTSSSNRIVSLDAQIESDLKGWKGIQAKYLLSLGIGQNNRTPVISSEAGGRVDCNNLSRWWRVFRNRYGFEDLRLHDLRHTHATMLVSSDLNIKAVSNRLGHASVEITLDLYTHAQREDDKKAAAIIGEIMSKPIAPMARVLNF